MHEECADEEDTLTYLRSVGRARGWSDKQRMNEIYGRKTVTT